MKRTLVILFPVAVVLWCATGCATAPKASRYEYIAVRVVEYTPGAVHIATTSGPHLELTDMVGIVVSEGPSKDQKLRFWGGSGTPFQPGQIYVVKAVHRTPISADPQEWEIVGVEK